MRHLFLLTALALAGALPPPKNTDTAVMNLNLAHRCHWSPEEVITVADGVKAIAARTPMSVPDVVACLGRLLSAIRIQDADIPLIPDLLDALEEVVITSCF